MNKTHNEELFVNEEEDLGVEKEDLGTEKITTPFDPETIKIDSQTVNLGTIIEHLEYKEIDLLPDFQRSIDLWDSTKKSRLIESIILGLPLPSFYFALESKEQDDGSFKDIMLVVDGLQRLCSIKDFVVDKKLKLSGLEFISDRYDEKGYDDLSREDQRKIKGAKITYYVISKGTPPDVKFIIFKRVNTAGLTLTEQEMRHALNQGLPALFINKLSKLESFLNATNRSIKTTRMEDREFINRFIAFYLLGYTDKYGGEIDVFLSEGMQELARKNDVELKIIEDAFERAMNCSISLFGKFAFRKRTSNFDKRKPISKALYDTLSVNIAKLTSKQQQKLIKEKDLINSRLQQMMSNDEVFVQSISNATGTKSSVVNRFIKIEKLIHEVIVDD